MEENCTKLETNAQRGKKKPFQKANFQKLNPVLVANLDDGRKLGQIGNLNPEEKKGNLSRNLSLPSMAQFGDFSLSPKELSSNPEEDMAVCKCLVPARHGNTLNSRRAASPIVRQRLSGWKKKEKERTKEAKDDATQFLIRFPSESVPIPIERQQEQKLPASSPYLVHEADTIEHKRSASSGPS
ncbi:hypothetical protein TNCV_2516551 [Trichonephila clavipes]|nr:hypothetical protein TNCV_2516551 [Trichonephila clavipes]